MCVCNIIRYYAFWDSGNQWIRIYLDQAYTGDLGVKVVGVKNIQASQYKTRMSLGRFSTNRSAN